MGGYKTSDPTQNPVEEGEELGPMEENRPLDESSVDLGTMDMPDYGSDIYLEGPVEGFNSSDSDDDVSVTSSSSRLGWHMRHSLAGFLQQSTYGLVKPVIRALGVDDIEAWPKTVIIGDMSNGKSTLLQRILMVHCLPTGAGLTTRQPVKLTLVNKPELTSTRVYLHRFDKTRVELTEILGTQLAIDEVQREMELACGKEPDTISAIELSLEIHSPDVPSIELIDLPGVVASEKLRLSTEHLVDKYIKEESTLVVCVVEAVLGCFDNSRALALINAEKRSNTIVCLTKLDDIPTRRFVPHVQHIIQEQRKLKYAGVVGVINPDNRDGVANVSVEDSYDHERDWIHKNISGITGVNLVYGRDLGINALLLRLDRLYHRVIKDTWTPKLVARLSKKMEEIQAALIELGPAPEEYHGYIAPLLQQYMSGMRKLAGRVEGIAKKFVKDAEGDEDDVGSKLDYDVTHLEDVEHREQLRVELLASASTFLRKLCDAITVQGEAVLYDEEKGIKETHHLSRFENFGSAVDSCLGKTLKQLSDEAQIEVLTYIEERFRLACSKPLESTFERDTCSGVVYQSYKLVVLRLLRLLEDTPLLVHALCREEPASFLLLEASAVDPTQPFTQEQRRCAARLLEESDEVKRRRDELNAELERLRKAKEVLEDIRKLSYDELRDRFGDAERADDFVRAADADLYSEL